VLRACRRTLKPCGRIAYYNIFINDKLSPDERRRLRGAGPAGVYTRAQQQGLLRSAGFTSIEETDVTEEYLRLQRALYEANKRHARSLRRSYGAARFDEDQAKRLRTVDGIEAGTLRRSLLVAERPRRNSG
jgi:hypothetical protein